MKSERARKILLDIGAPLPPWMKPKSDEVVRDEKRATLSELKNISKSLLQDFHVLSVINQDNGSAGMWLSKLSSESNLTKGTVSRCITRLKKYNLCHTQKRMMGGHSTLFVYPGGIHRKAESNTKKDGNQVDMHKSTSPSLEVVQSVVDDEITVNNEKGWATPLSNWLSKVWKPWWRRKKSG